MSGPRLPDLPLWDRHEQRVLAALQTALRRLGNTSPHGDENTLNLRLRDALRQVNKENQQAGNVMSLEEMPIWEARNPPTPETEGSASEKKIPDLQWRYEDHQEPDARYSERVFVIECKRLGAPARGRRLNVEYADHGVRRFVEPEWSYGKDVPTGAMVGYVESLTLEGIVADVNGALDRLEVPALTLPQAVGDSLTEMEHSFNRPFKISPFRLVHLWIDIRPARLQIRMRQHLRRLFG